MFVHSKLGTKTPSIKLKAIRQKPTNQRQKQSLGNQNDCSHTLQCRQVVLEIGF
jgi:hypothetical protein